VLFRLDAARGGILFIDEAYELGKGHFGEEALTTLVAAMTDPVYKGMSIIIAGYPDKIRTMLERNAGLKSRFQRLWTFPNWTCDDCVKFINEKANKEHFKITVNRDYSDITNFFS
jgi:hypothetical protein